MVVSELIAIQAVLVTFGLFLLGLGVWFGAARLIRKLDRVDNVSRLVELDAIYKVCNKKGLDPERALRITRVLEAMEYERFRVKPSNKTFRGLLEEYSMKELEGGKK